MQEAVAKAAPGPPRADGDKGSVVRDDQFLLNRSTAEPPPQRGIVSGVRPNPPTESSFVRITQGLGLYRNARRCIQFQTREGAEGVLAELDLDEGDLPRFERFVFVA
jgi:hypothetical protein